MNWDTQFLDLFRRCLALYQGGNTDYLNYYSSEDLCFLESIGSVSYTHLRAHET